MRCDWCGKFRKGTDLAMYELANYWRDDVEQVLVCRWCDPTMFGGDDEQ